MTLRLVQDEPYEPITTPSVHYIRGFSDARAEQRTRRRVLWLTAIVSAVLAIAAIGFAVLCRGSDEWLQRIASVAEASRRSGATP